MTKSRQHKSDRLEFLDRLGIKDGFIEGFKHAASDELKAATKEALKERSGEAVAGAIGDVSGALAGALVGTLVKTLLGAQDRMRKDLSKLVGVKMKAGMTMAVEALGDHRISGGSAFVEDSLRAAINNLEEAFHLLDDVSKNEPVRQCILFAQGLCASRMSGGHDYARRRLQPFIDSFVQRGNELADEAAAMHQEWRSKEIKLLIRAAGSDASFATNIDDPRLGQAFFTQVDSLSSGLVWALEKRPAEWCLGIPSVASAAKYTANITDKMQPIIAQLMNVGVEVRTASIMRHFTRISSLVRDSEKALWSARQLAQQVLLRCPA